MFQSNTDDHPNPFIAKVDSVHESNSIHTTRVEVDSSPTQHNGQDAAYPQLQTIAIVNSPDATISTPKSCRTGLPMLQATPRSIHKSRDMVNKYCVLDTSPKKDCDRISPSPGSFGLTPKRRHSFGSIQNMDVASASEHAPQDDTTQHDTTECKGTDLKASVDEDTRLERNSDTSPKFRKRKAHQIAAPKTKRIVQRYCICQKPYDSKQFYIQCDECDEWYHGSCVSLTDQLSEQIDKWFCPLCIDSKSLKLMWKSTCYRDDCFERARTEELYCTDECALAIAVPRYEAIRERFTVKKQYSNIDREMMKQELDKVRLECEHFKIQIRNLEKKQLFIDHCVDKAYSYRREYSHQSSKLCAFDHRILEYGVSDEACADLEDIIGLQNIEIQDVGGEVASVEVSISEYCCNFEGRCPMHDNWEAIKSEEVAMELKDQIRLYCLGKQKEMECVFRLINPAKRDKLLSLILQNEKVSN